VSVGLGKDGEWLAWIFGSSRSGSTWLLRMLTELDGVVPIDDPHLGHHLGVWRPIPLAWAAAEEEPELSTLLEVKAEEPDYFFCERRRESWSEPLRGLDPLPFRGGDRPGRPRGGAAHRRRQGARLARRPAAGRALPRLEADLPAARRP
jgi:hypothetical protein